MTGRLSVFTTFYPSQYFAQRIGGDMVEVTCPVPDGEDAIFWMPDDDVIQGYQSAGLIVLNGAGFAMWVDKVSLPASRIIDTAHVMESEFMKFEDAVEHSHGKEGAHSHEGIDGHTWIDPVNAKVQSGEIRNALVRRLPDAHEVLEANYLELCEDLDDLDARLTELGGMASEPILCSHPAYNYIARRYGWNIANLDLDPEVMPAEETMSRIADLLETHTAKVILWESDPLPEIVERFERELRIRSVTFSPCELLSAEEGAGGADYLSVMKENIERLSLAMSSISDA